MAAITLKREQLPFSLAGKGSLTVEADLTDPRKPIPPGSGDLFKLGVGVEGTNPLEFGTPGTTKLTLKAGTKARIAPIFASPGQDDVAELKERGLDTFCDTHPGRFLMLLQLGASADLGLKTSVRFEPLTVQGSVDVGADGGYTLIKAYDRDLAAHEVLEDLLESIRMPRSVDGALEEGTVMAYEYGGYLKLGLSASLGYRIQGAPSFNLAELKLSEKYTAGLLGTIGMQASVAGRFSVEVQGVAPPQDLAGSDDPGHWLQVTVRRRRTREFRVAADVSLDSGAQLKGLPNSSDELLGALLGVNSRSWMNYLRDCQSSLSSGEGKLPGDGLAHAFLEKLTGKAITALTAAPAPEPKVQAAVEACETAGDRATALLDIFSDRIDTELTAQLQKIIDSDNWEILLSGVTPDLRRVIGQLLGGDALQFATGLAGPAKESFEKLRHAAAALADLIHLGGHKPLLEVIRLAKEEFGLEVLFRQLATVESADDLKSKSAELVGGFAGRLIGRALSEVHDGEIAGVFRQLRAIVAKKQEFEKQVFGKVRELTQHTAKGSLHAAYARSSERDALLRVQVNVDDAHARQLLATAFEADFSTLMDVPFSPGSIRLLEGTLTHRARSESNFKVNVIGWHRDWSYQGLDRILLNTEQAIRTDANGALTVHTSFELQKEKERRTGLKGTEEKVYTNFVLRFLGESSGALQFDKDSQQFLVDVIESMSAKYDLQFHDNTTREKELAHYLSFADEMGVLEPGTTVDDIRSMLPSDRGNFGKVDAKYEVVFQEEGLRRVFSRPVDARAIRGIMRRIVFANYVREQDSHLTRIGWCYATPGVFEFWEDAGADFENRSSRTFRVSSGEVTLNQIQLRVLGTLFRIQERMVRGLQSLERICTRGAGSPPMAPKEFEDALSEFGKALNEFDGMDEGVNTVFGVIDQLIRVSGGESLRGSSLQLTSEADGRSVEKLFMRLPSAAVAAGGASV